MRSGSDCTTLDIAKEVEEGIWLRGARQICEQSNIWARLQVPAVAHDRVDLVVALHRAWRCAQVRGGRGRGARPPGKALAQHRRAQEGARVQAAREQQRRVQLAPDALRARALGLESTLGAPPGQQH